MTAMAENSNGHGDLVVRDDALSAYVDGSGHLFIPGNDKPVNTSPADAVLSVDAYRVLFFGTVDAGTLNEQTRLISLNLSD